jgi:hypothetical protein
MTERVEFLQAVTVALLVALVGALLITGVAMVLDRDDCGDRGGAWRMDWSTATSTCHWS